MTLLNPQFIKFNNNENLPENVRNKYFLYYTFEGLLTNGSIKAIYVNVDSIDKLNTFIQLVSIDNTVLYTGTENFVLNSDYYLNECFTECETLLPNYIIDNDINTEYFNEVTIYDTFVNYLSKKNEYTNLTFSEEELLSFYSTFCSQILKLTTFVPETNEDHIYNSVLNYFASYQSDSTSIMMGLLFNSMYGEMIATTNTCGCSDSKSDTNKSICTTSCIEYYKNAMFEYIKQMLSNIEFYNRWFFILDEETGISSVNELLIDNLTTLINEFLLLDMNISTAVNKANINCGCPSVSVADDSCNRGILNNYLLVLDYVRNNKIEANTNKIKVYGSEFAKILPDLIF